MDVDELPIPEYTLRYRRYIEKGICVYCHKAKAEPGLRKCRPCADKSNKVGRETRNKLREMGFCPCCGSRKIYENEKYCDICTERDRELHQKYREENRESDRLRHRNYMRNRYKQKTENGYCPRCGSRKPLAGKTLCPVCSKKDMERYYHNSTRSTKEQRDFWKENGFCYQCGEKAIEGKKLCQKHYDIVMKTHESPKFIEAQKNNYWRKDDELIFMKRG